MPYIKLQDFECNFKQHYVRDTCYVVMCDRRMKAKQTDAMASIERVWW